MEVDDTHLESTPWRFAAAVVSSSPSIADGARKENVTAQWTSGIGIIKAAASGIENVEYVQLASRVCKNGWVTQSYACRQVTLSPYHVGTDTRVALCRQRRGIVTTASILFHRFYMRHSLFRHDRVYVAFACFMLSAKVEEAGMRTKDIVERTYRILCEPGGDTGVSREAHACRLLDTERIVCYTLEFALHVAHPYDDVTAILRRWKEEGLFGARDVKYPDLSRLADAAKTLAFDAMCTEVCLQYTSYEVAVSCLWMAWKLLEASCRIVIPDAQFSALVPAPTLTGATQAFMDAYAARLKVEDAARRSPAVREAWVAAAAALK